MYPLLKKLLFTLDPEAAHALAKNATRFIPSQVMAQATQVRHPALSTQIGGTSLLNPIGLAAGFDKNGDMLQFLGSVGFGYLELGSVTALPSMGNPKPRIFRLTQDQSLINRMGLPNIGAEAFCQHMQKRRVRVPYGVNIAKTPARESKKSIHGIDDFLTTEGLLAEFGCYVTLNLSCPNTQDGTTFENPLLFADLIQAINAARHSRKDKRPLLVKLSPMTNKSSLHKLVELAIKHNVDGFVLTNTTPLRPPLRTSEAKIKKIGAGGLSGTALLDASNKTLRTVYDIVGTSKLLMGVGGILTFEDLLTKISCGARLFQIYTGFIYQGPFFVRHLNRKLIRYCEKQGAKNYQELIGHPL